MLPFVGLILLLAAFFAAGWYFSNQVIAIPSYPVEETYRLEVENGKLVETEFNAWEKEEVHLRSSFGCELYGLYLPVENPKGTVILAHGVTFSLYGSVKYVNLFRSRGWSVFMYDHRAHGRSGGDFKTYGWTEKHDLKVIVDWACQKGGKVGIHGESYGAAITLQALPLLKNLAFVISDCAYSDLTELLTYHLRHDYRLPAFPLLPAASLISYLRAGFWFGQIAPLRALAQLNGPPILFVHGAADDFTPTRMGQDLFNAYPGPKCLYLAPGAGHGDSFWSDPAAYNREVGAFLAKFGLE
jgi:fermentation-respiration switch protein FrsA (DUF1100 family)